MGVLFEIFLTLSEMCLPEPQIKKHPSNVTQLIESKAVLQCVTLGNPKPDIIWMKDESVVKVTPAGIMPSP